MTLSWKHPAPRLGLALSLLALVVFAFSYWWLGNATHELVGLAICAGLLRHLANNLGWWARLARGRWTPLRMLSAALTLVLAVDVLVLAGSSAMISRALHSILPLPDIFSLRELHWFSAFWMLPLVGLHLGLHGERIWLLAGSALGLPALPRGLLWLCAAIAFALAVQGIAGGSAIDLWPRLAFRYSLAMWDFNASVLPFFLHCLSAIWLFAAIGFVLALIAGRSPLGQHRTGQP